MTLARRAAAHVMRLTGWLVLLGVLAATVPASVQGVRFLPVLTESMTPYAPAGSLVLTVPAAGEELAVGDVVAFRPPAPYQVTGDRPIFHRLATLDSQNGQPFMTTKGDANATPDPWQVATSGAVFGRGVVVIPHLGAPVAGGPRAALALVLGTAALIAGVRLFRRSATDRSGRHRPDLATRRGAAAHTLTAAVHVPAAHWSTPEGPARARTQARAALDRSLDAHGLVLSSPPEDHLEDDGDGGVHLRLSATAGPA